MDTSTPKNRINIMKGINEITLIIDKISANKLMLGGAEMQAIMKNIQIMLDNGSYLKIPLFTIKLRLYDRE